MLDLMIKLNPTFTEADREACLSLIDRMVEMSEIARKDGFLALIDAVETEEDDFLREAILFVADGYDIDELKRALQYMIIAEGVSGAALLGRFLVAEGVLLIHQAERAKNVLLRLCSMLGAKYVARWREEELEKERIHSLDQFYELVSNYNKYNGDLADFESALLGATDAAVQNALESFKTIIITSVLRGCTFEMIRKIMENLPKNRQSEIFANWNFMGPIRVIDIEHFALKLLSALTAESKEIII